MADKNPWSGPIIVLLIVVILVLVGGAGLLWYLSNLVMM